MHNYTTLGAVRVSLAQAWADYSPGAICDPLRFFIQVTQPDKVMLMVNEQYKRLNKMRLSVIMP